MKVDSLTIRTVNGFLWIFTSTGVQAVLQFVVLIILARLLSPEEFGIVGAGLVIVGFAQVFSQIGIGPAIVQRSKISQNHVRVGFTLSVIISCFVGLSIATLAPAIAIFFSMPELESVVRVMSLIFPITGVSLIAHSLFQREMQFKKLAIIQVISFLLGYGFIGVLLAYLGWGVWALVYAQLGQVTVKSIILLGIYPKAMGFALSAKEIKEILTFGTGFSLGRIANAIAGQADNLVVGRWLGAEALGIYGRAYQFLVLPVNLFGKVVDKVLFPAMASVQDDRDRLRRAYRRSVGISFMINLPLGAILFVMAPELVSLILGEQWISVAATFQILSLIIALRASYKLSDSLARATGAVYRRAWRQLIYAGAVFFGALIGQYWGVKGVAVGVAIAICINYTLMHQLSIRLIGASWSDFFGIYIRHLTVAVTTGISVWGVKMFMLSLAVPCSGVLVAGIVAAFLVGVLFIVFSPSIFGEEGVWLKASGKAYIKRVGLG